MTQYLVTQETIKMGHGGMLSYPVVGESFYADHFNRLYHQFGSKSEVLTAAYLVPEPRNPVDKNAVAIVVDKWVVGHLARHVSKEFFYFLDGKVGECRARVFFDLYQGRNSIELDLIYPPSSPEVLDGKTTSRDVPFVGTDEPNYDMTQVTTKFANITFIDLAPGESHYGVATVHAGFRDSPEIVDSETLNLLGHPYEKISWDFNVFARSKGGEFRVRYMVQLNERGRFRLTLDSSGLPKFKPSRY